MSLFIRAAVVLSTALLAAGCSSTRKQEGPQGPTREDELREAGELLALFSGRAGRGYREPADLAPFAEGLPLGRQAVTSGAVVIVPGATMPGEGDRGGSNAVVAYEKDAPTQGGLVLRQNRTINRMTAEELQSALGAGK
jgi:hypothetical protein